jgi:phosphatidylinositol-3-phosphatase
VCQSGQMERLPAAGTAAAFAAMLLVLVGCQPQPDPAAVGGDPAPATAAVAEDGVTTAPGAVDPGPKVLLLLEENSDPDQVLEPGAAPYLQGILEQGATVTDMDAGYPADCPSLPAYLLLTSGSTHGICDNGGPEEHLLEGPSIFSEVADAGREWRVFAESMDRPCRRSNSPDGRYLVRHTGAP